MKKFILVLGILVFASTSFACDICGCSNGNIYLGLLPGFRTTFFGVRYHYMNYNTFLKSDATQYSHNFYNTVEAWGGINVGKRWQLLAFVPYHINKQVDDDGITNTNGIGDVTLLASYLIFHKLKTSENTAGVEQQLWIGGGVKLPTGKFDADVTDPNITVADVNAQLGTGSLDVLVNALYNIKVGKWGLNNNVSYKENSARNSYSFGNKFTANTIAYYTLKHKFNTILPNAGIMYENVGGNKLAGNKVAATGGYIATASVGVEVSIKSITLGASAAVPFSQNYAEGQTSLSWRGTFHVSYTL